MTIKRKSFVIFFIFVIINLFNCDTSKINEINGNEHESSCCDNSTSQRVKIEFTSSIVEHEYIVHFKSYYKEETRKNFIKSALDNNSEVKSHAPKKQNKNFLIDNTCISYILIKFCYVEDQKLDDNRTAKPCI